MNVNVTKNLSDSIPHPQPLIQLFAIALACATGYSNSAHRALRTKHNLTAHPHTNMAKTQNSKKETKKQPLLTPKEKKLAKQAKKKG